MGGIELKQHGERFVDLHPVTFDAHGYGRQADLDGGYFEYPPDCFVSGRIGGTTVRCLSADRQRRFRSGYELRDVDRRDLALLRGL
jgi:lincosamide nucleotidyltransferase A/C/D/E